MTTSTKVALITGAAGGIGSATAQTFAQEGYALMLADLDEVNLKKLADKLEAKGTRVVCLAGDLGEETYRQNLVTQTVVQLGRLDVLVNNAAWRIPHSLRNLELATWEKTINICLTAPVFLSKAAAQAMEKQGLPGVIINLSSAMAARPSGLAVAYIACKGALESLTKELAITYGRSGIRVVCVAPGYIETEMSNDYQNQEGDNISTQLISHLTDFIPLGRGGAAQEVSQTIAWLCSDAAAYISGTTITVDGGFLPNFNSYSIKKLQFPEEF